MQHATEQTITLWGTPHLTPSASPRMQQATCSAAQGLRGSAPSGGGGGASTDDLALLLDYRHHEKTPAADPPRAAGKTRLLVVPLDSDHGVPAAAAVLRRVQEQLGRGGSGGSVALGVLSMLGFESTRDHLAAAGVDVGGVDCMACNSGADVWMQLQSGEWESDEQYEGKSPQGGTAVVQRAHMESRSGQLLVWAAARGHAGLMHARTPSAAPPSPPRSAD